MSLLPRFLPMSSKKFPVMKDLYPLRDNRPHSIGSSRMIRPPDFIRFFFYWIGIFTTCLVAFLVSASRMTVKSLQFQAPINGSYGSYGDTLFEVKLTAEAISVDPVARTITMNWYPDFTSLDCDDPVTIDIFLSSVLLDTSSPSWSPQLGDQVTYRLNSTESCPGIITAPYASFRTVTKLLATEDFLQLQGIPQTTFQNYPFDIYIAPFMFYTQNLNTGAILPLEVSSSFGVAVNFEISLLHNALLSSNPVEDNLLFYLQINRSMATKVFVVMVAITNWLTATAFLTICAATAVYRPHKIYAEMFVVPVGALFAFSSIRANLPGAPDGFGAVIDIFSILPVLIIMSLCSFSLLLIILYRRICQEVIEVEGDKEGFKEMAPRAPLSDQTFLDTPRFPSQLTLSEFTRSENSAEQANNAKSAGPSTPPMDTPGK